MGNYLPNLANFVVIYQYYMYSFYFVLIYELHHCNNILISVDNVPYFIIGIVSNYFTSSSSYKFMLCLVFTRNNSNIKILNYDVSTCST